MERSRLLNDHKRVGKRFIPPFAQLGLSEVRWIQDILPELLWLGLLNDTLGFTEGARLSLALAKAAHTLRPKATPWFGCASAFTELNQEDTAIVVETLTQAGDLAPLQEALGPLLRLYPSFPLGFLRRQAEQDASKDRTRDIGRVRDVLTTTFDRTTTPAVMMQADAVYIMFVTGVLKVKEGLALASFPEVERYPETELSLKVGAAVRATVSGTYGTFRSGKDSWPAQFWNRGLELCPCAT